MANRYETKNKIANRLSMLQTNVDAWISNLRTLFYFKQEEEVTLRQSDSTAKIKENIVPNALKYVNMSVLHGTVSPTGTVTGKLGQIYINVEDKSVWICMKDGVKTWKQLFTSYNLELHDYGTTSHSSYIARVGGSTDTVFNIRNANDPLDPLDPSYDFDHLEYNDRSYLDLLTKNLTTAVNINYIGRLAKLDTYIKTTIVDALNEIYLYALLSSYKDEEYAGIQNGALNKGNINDKGNADLINSSLTEGTKYTTPGIYTMNVATDDIITIKLVGGGGARAYINGDYSNYVDALVGIQYWHEGGSGGYFKGRFKAPSIGTLKVITPSKGTNSSGGDIVDMTGIYTLPTVGTGGDAIATFTPQNGVEVEIARARGGKPGYPAYENGFWANVNGGSVTYNSNYFVTTEIPTTITGTVGQVWAYYPESSYSAGQVIFEKGEAYNGTLYIANSGIYEIIAVSGGGGGLTSDGGTDPFGDTAWAHWYYTSGATGAYYNGTLRITRGNYNINVGAAGSGSFNSQSGDGGATSIGTLLNLSAGQGSGQNNGSFTARGSGGSLTTIQNEVSRIAYSAGYGQAFHGGFKDAYTLSYDYQYGPSNNYGLGAYGKGGNNYYNGSYGCSIGGNGTCGYLKVIYRGIH